MKNIVWIRLSAENSESGREQRHGDAGRQNGTRQNRSEPRRTHYFGLILAMVVSALAILAGLSLCDARAQSVASASEDPANPGHELPTHIIPNIGPAAEFYFSPDGKSIIGNAKRADDDSYHVYTLNTDGTNIRRINDHGDDACSYYFPDGQRIVWTSTKDHPELPKGNYSDPSDYPQGAELYTSNLDGSDVHRLTNNTNYEAEVSVRPDGKWILFGKQVNRKIDLWRMRPDGSEPVQVTHLADWEPGGAFYFPHSNKIIFRAWKVADQEAHKHPLPMSLFTINDDGTDLKKITNDDGTNWSPYPAPDGHHYVFVKVLQPGNNYEVYLGDLNSPEQVRLTYNSAFDGFPVISPDGHWLLFASSRDAAAGPHTLTLYLQDISSLHVGPPEVKASAK